MQSFYCCLNCLYIVTTIIATYCSISATRSYVIATSHTPGAISFIDKSITSTIRFVSSLTTYNCHLCLPAHIHTQKNLLCHAHPSFCFLTKRVVRKSILLRTTLFVRKQKEGWAWQSKFFCVWI